jgi:ammonium transporter, Amt family
VIWGLLAQVTVDEVQEGLDLDSAILAEQFYFWTVAVMWLIHVGFMAYEAGAVRRKNVMSVAVKNILTIAVITPTFYFLGWWIYGCMQEGFIPSHITGTEFYQEFCDATVPWSANMGPNLGDNISGVFWAAFLLFSWTTGSIMSGALVERVRLSAYLILTALLGSVVWILDAAWGWSAGGWLTIHFGFHDAIASGVVHGVAGAFALGVLLNLGPRIGKYDRDGNARSFKPHNLHLTLMGLMLIFTGFYAFYAACLVIQSTAFPGWANIYLSPATLSAITWTITIGFAGGFTGGYFASRGDPFWMQSGGLAGVISVSAGADVYHPALVYLLAIFGGAFAVWVGTFIEKRLRIDDVVGAVAVHGACGFLGLLYVGIFAAGYPTGVGAGGLGVESSLLGQLVGMATFFPLGFIPGYVASWLLRQANVLRVPPEVEVEGMDIAEFQEDYYPEFEPQPEIVTLPDGRTVESGQVLLDAFEDLKR